jgi:hypothetical protein
MFSKALVHVERSSSNNPVAIIQRKNRGVVLLGPELLLAKVVDSDDCSIASEGEAVTVVTAGGGATTGGGGTTTGAGDGSSKLMSMKENKSSGSADNGSNDIIFSFSSRFQKKALGIDQKS